MEQTLETRQVQSFKQDSVEISRNAKGDYAFKVKIYGDSETDLDGIELRTFALEMRVRQRITALEEGGAEEVE